MKKNLLLYTILALAVCYCSHTQFTFAATTNRVTLGAENSETNSVAANGGIINTNINPTSGALDASFTPGFKIVTNSGQTKNLTQSWACNTTSGMQNAVYNDGTYAYVIFTNTDVLPDVSSVNNIKTLAPTPALNPNAISYLINDPPNIIGVLQTEFSPSANNWKLHLSKQGTTNTSQTIPGTSIYPNTFSGDDDAGRYQSTVTLSFDP